MKATRDEKNVKTAKASNAKRRKRRRHGRYTLHYILIGIFVFAAGIVLSLTVFFKLEGVDVTGNTKYLDEQITQIAAIPIEENMFMIDREIIEKRILESFTYIDEVNLKYRLPPRILIDIKEAVPMAYAQLTDERYAILSDKGKVLEILEGNPPEGEALVIGLNLKGISEGETILASNSEEMKMLSYIEKAMEEVHVEGIGRVDVSDRLNIRLLYDDRIVIDLGTEGELEYKLRFAKYALENSIEENFEGVIDASITKEVRIRASKLDENKNPIKNSNHNPDDDKIIEGLPEGEDINSSSQISGESSSSQSSGTAENSSNLPKNPQSSEENEKSGTPEKEPQNDEKSSSSGSQSNYESSSIPEVTPIGPSSDIKTG